MMMNHSRLRSMAFMFSFLFLASQAEAKKPIKAVIFDIGGVIIQSDKSNQHEFISRHLHIPENVVKTTLKKAARPLSLGEINETTFWKKYSADHGGTLPENWNEIWEEFYRNKTKVNRDVIEIIKDLKSKGIQTAILSDTIPSHDAVNQDRDIYPHFSSIFLSYQIKLAKPDEKIYRYVVAHLKLQPEECVFIDDRANNIEAAQKIGMSGIQFKNTTELKEKLKLLEINF